MNYQQVKDALSQLAPFTHSDTMRGAWNEAGDTYEVWSYQTKIAWTNVYGEWWVNPQYYSRTMSRQVNIVKNHMWFIKGEMS